MRQLYNTIVAATTSQKEALDDKKDVRDGQDYIKYLPKRFDKFEDDIDSLVAAGDCNVVVVNFGTVACGLVARISMVV